MTVRLKRGRPLIGRVVDHAGRPSAGAKLFPIRQDGLNIRVVDEVMGEGFATGLLDPGITRAVADAQGRFRLTGVGETKTIGVSAASMHFCRVPMPPPGDEPTIRLPEPGTIRLPYAIDGDEAEAGFWLHYTDPDDPDDRLQVNRNFKVANRGEIVLRDASPGEYTLWRIKPVAHGDYRGRVGVDHRTFSVRRGDLTLVNFVRQGGSPIEGKVTGPEKGKPRMSFVGIEPVADPAAKGLDFLIDIIACDEGGRFRTPGVPPGKYVVRAVGYRNQPRYGPFDFLEMSDFAGSSTVVVPRDGKPPEVRIKFDDPAEQNQPAKLETTSRQ